MLDADGDERSDVQRCFELDGAEVPKVGEAELVEILVGDHSVVDEIQLDSALDGGDPTVGIDEANVRVRCEDARQSSMHGVTDRSPEVFDRPVTILYGFSWRGEVAS